MLVSIWLSPLYFDLLFWGQNQLVAFEHLAHSCLDIEWHRLHLNTGFVLRSFREVSLQGSLGCGCDLANVRIISLRRDTFSHRWLLSQYLPLQPKCSALWWCICNESLWPALTVMRFTSSRLPRSITSHLPQGLKTSRWRAMPVRSAWFSWLNNWLNTLNLSLFANRILHLWISTITRFSTTSRDKLILRMNVVVLRVDD